MNNQTRQLIVKLSTKAGKEGKVSVRLLSTVLSSVQQAIIQLGKSRYDMVPSKKGRTPSVIDRECELFFLRAEPGSLSATLELPSKEATLFPDYPQFGETVLSDMHQVLRGINSNSAEMIHQTIPNPRYRKRIFDILTPVLPSPDADYDLSFSFEKDEALKPAKPKKEQLETYIGSIEEFVEEEKTQEVLIEAKCIATLKNGEIATISELLEYELFEEEDLRPYRTDKISWQGRTILLNHEIACSVSKEDHFVVIKFEPLNIRAYAVSRDEAIADFNEEFIVLLDEYANADNLTLSPDAIELKNYLSTLVKEVIQE